MSRKIRKDSLEQLDSPEELQERLIIVSFKNWVALGILIALLSVAVFWSIFSRIPIQATGKAIIFDAESIVLVRSEMLGNVMELKVKNGSSVSQGEPLALLRNFELEAMIYQQKLLIEDLEMHLVEKDEGFDEYKRQLITEKAKLEGLEFILKKTDVRAPFSGTVVSINVKEGDSVSPGSVLIVLQCPQGLHEKQSIYGIIPFESGAQVKLGMDVMIDLASVDVAKYGYLRGRVEEIFPYLTPLEQSPLRMIPTSEMQELIDGAQAFVIIKIDPLADPSTFTKYLWTTQEGPPFPLLEGTIGSVKVILSEKRPISFLIPAIE